MTTMSIAHRPRLAGQLMLGTRQAAGVLTGRHPDLVRQRCRPVACDVVTHVPLYDLDQVAAAFRSTPRRR
jgi:hypothetical protein